MKKTLILIFIFISILSGASYDECEKKYLNLSPLEQDEKIKKCVGKNLNWFERAEIRLDENKIFIEKKEWVTFVTDENSNGPIRTILNTVTSWFKGLSVHNFVFGFFSLAVVYALITNPVFWLVMIVNDLYYANPLAILGTLLDVVVQYIKFFLAFIQIFIVDLNVFITWGVLITISIVIYRLNHVPKKESQNNKQTRNDNNQNNKTHNKHHDSNHKKKNNNFQQYDYEEDPYTVLNCKSTDTDLEIKKSYRKLVKKFHPDFIQGKDLDNDFIEFANQKIKTINQAYDTIQGIRKIK